MTYWEAEIDKAGETEIIESLELQHCTVLLQSTSDADLIARRRTDARVVAAARAQDAKIIARAG